MKTISFICLFAMTPLLAAEPRRPAPPPLPPDVAMTADIVFAKAGGHELKLDLYRAKDAKSPRPAVLLVHGGGWRAGDKMGFRREAPELVKAGFVVMAVNYRLMPTAQGLELLDDVQRAIRWTRKHAAEYGAAADHIGLAGGSAGAHLISLAATWPDRESPDEEFKGLSARVQCVAEWFGPAKFTDAGQGSERLRGMFKDLIERDPDFLKKWSPVEHASAQAPPFLILHGDADPVVPFSHGEALEAALKKAGASVELVKFPGATHGFINYNPRNEVMLKAYEQSWAKAREFFKAKLKP